MSRKPIQPIPGRQAAGTALGTGLFFLAVCLNSSATVKRLSIFLIVLVLAAVFLFYRRLRDRFTPVIAALALVTLMDGLSNLYAVSGKFALYEFLKVLASFCLVLLLLAFTGEVKPERQAAAVLEGCAALAGLVSIDLLSTHFISGPALAVLGWFTPDYLDPVAVEGGVRMTSIFINPNVFAGCMGIGVLLSLGLAVSSVRSGVRTVHLVCLSVNSLAFVLAFSMGACAMIVPAFLVFLALTGREKRIELLILMAETLLVTLLCAFPISVTSMTVWSGVQPIPLVCAVGGAAALCALDLLAGRRFAAKLAGHGKAVFGLAAALLAALAAFVAAACVLTTGVTFRPGESLRRSAYPVPGSYRLTAESDGDPYVTVESQDQKGAIMHTAEELYRGPASRAQFTVPEDSLVVWFTFSSEGETHLESVEYTGENGSGKVPLGYRLLPGFIANRLQGLLANQNAIQRFIFFEDGLKLFRRSPVFGLGMGAFENGIKGVQSFFYETKYVHNHYIQTLVDTGLIGLVLFLGLLAVSALAVWRGRREPLAPALGAALAFMAGHCAVEVVFSSYPYLPMAFGVFAAISLGCGGIVPVPAWVERKEVRVGQLLGVCALLAVFGVLLNCNIIAQGLNQPGAEPGDLERAVSLDRFEWADYMTTYVARASGSGADGDVWRKADEYAARLEKVDSNTAPFYLAEYYFKTGRTERGLAMAEKYVRYMASDSDAWQKTFDLLELYQQDTEEFRAGAAHIADLLDSWNHENLGRIEMNERTQAFIAQMRT